MADKKNLSDYSEREFLELLELIINTNGSQPDKVLDPLLEHFESTTEHPAGTDLIFWPDTAEKGEPEEIVKLIKEWRRENGKDGFKPE
ncbi:bacteriocin immunity protein [Pseudomonas sp. GD03858]|uniref:bacteriocin immunity protein n=1 Tax=unclassified Pseudomonas TaxID=196821 RepID=UPI0024489FEA|nr:MULTISPECIES: bacteriocin immunity protein [unclassified Pseudomonas]MDH0648087.1 bacteriocin immunity protein [Pseudomonas sp. GD03867]MDH0665468.1 bacteriocin immunity protein [Pseudomonas sp. GD03858]